MKGKWKISTILIVALLLTAFPLTSYATTTQEKLNQAEQEKKDTQEKLEDTQENIDNLKEEQNTLKGELSNLNSQLSQVSDNLSDLEEQIDTKETEIKSKKEAKNSKITDNRNYKHNFLNTFLIMTPKILYEPSICVIKNCRKNKKSIDLLVETLYTVRKWSKGVEKWSKMERR